MSYDCEVGLMGEVAIRFIFDCKCICKELYSYNYSAIQSTFPARRFLTELGGWYDHRGKSSSSLVGVLGANCLTPIACKCSSGQMWSARHGVLIPSPYTLLYPKKDNKQYQKQYHIISFFRGS